MRRDAADRRESLLKAAATCFAQDGYLVPLDEIAERAGVGRGTFYRNFRDRMALVLAIFDREVDRLEEKLDRQLPLEDAIGQLAIGGASASALFARIAADLPLDEENIAAFNIIGERLVQLLAPFVDRAHGDGTLNPAIDARQMLLVLRMVGGLLKPRWTEAEMRSQIAEAMPLLFTGLSPRST